MMTIICGTNRPKSNSEFIVRTYLDLAKRQEVDVNSYSLVNLPDDFINASEYGTPPDSFSQILNNIILPTSHFVFVVPEYNGSYPGILKVFLDTIHPSVWVGKKAALVGVSTGRAGNLRGLDHLLGVLHYLKMEVYSQKPLMSSVHQFLDEEGKLTNEEYVSLLKSQIKAFNDF